MHRRDKLATLLWTECDQTRARNALRQAFAVLREALGTELFRAGGSEEIGLVHEAVHTDVIAFRAASCAARWEDAIHLFGGPLLDGLQIAQAPEFMEWLEQSRTRLKRAYMRCLAGVAVEREDLDRWDDALEWWCRLADLDPFNVRVAAGLVRCQAAGGDPAGALQKAEEARICIRTETGVEAASELEAAFSEGCGIRRARRRPA
jgi:DNA-binding SARP family transcriptional activator